MWMKYRKTAFSNVCLFWKGVLSFVIKKGHQGTRSCACDWQTTSNQSWVPASQWYVSISGVFWAAIKKKKETNCVAKECLRHGPRWKVKGLLSLWQGQGPAHKSSVKLHPHLWAQSHKHTHTFWHRTRKPYHLWQSTSHFGRSTEYCSLTGGSWSKYGLCDKRVTLVVVKENFFWSFF